MNEMQYPLYEKIGNPTLLVGRKKEFTKAKKILERNGVSLGRPRKASEWKVDINEPLMQIKGLFFLFYPKIGLNNLVFSKEVR